MQQVPSPHQAPLRATFLTLLLTIFVADLHGAPDEIVQEVTLGEETLTMRLTRVDLRSPNFDFRIQQAQGTIRRLNAVPERSYLGSVDDRPGAVSCGIQLDDGTFKGAILFARGSLLLHFRCPHRHEPSQLFIGPLAADLCSPPGIATHEKP